MIQPAYEWPEVTAVHPEHGSYRMDVHCLRSPAGALVLVAFMGVPRRRQAEIVRDLAVNLGDTIEPLTEADISNDMAIDLAAQFHAGGTDLVVMGVKRPRGEA